MSTTQDMIFQVERWLLNSTEREERNRLQGAHTGGTTTLTFAYELGGIVPGTILSIDLEVFYVWAVNESANTATVSRGEYGSALGVGLGVAHSDQAAVYVNPRFPWFNIVQTANIEIEDLNNPTYGLYAVDTVDLTTSASQYTYDLPAVGLEDIIDVRWDIQTTANEWPLVRRWDLMRNQPTTEFASGQALRLNESVDQGRTMRVKYKQRFATGLGSTVDDIETLTGIPESMQDIIALGTAARLLGSRDGRRSYTEAEADSRRADETRVGDASRAASSLWAMRAQRIKSEAARLDMKYPPRNY